MIADSGGKTVLVHLAHSYPETCGDTTGGMSGLSSLLLQAYSETCGDNTKEMHGLS